MHITENEIYQRDVDLVVSLPLKWERLENKTVLLTGASGMIGSFLVDVLMKKANTINCKVIALGRNEERAHHRFYSYWDSENFVFITADTNNPLEIPSEKIDYVIHAASNTHPAAYSTDPIGTIATNVIGTYNLLELAVKKKTERFVFLSSVEIYGENRGDAEEFLEEYCGYIDCNTLRAGYPESKRAGESLCQAYIVQKGLDIVIPRLSRIYGPTMLDSDTKALSQFIKKGVHREDIVLKSEGTQFYSYCYVADAVSGILTCLLEGENGEAYNIADIKSDISLRDLAGLIAKETGKTVVFEMPDAVEKAGYSKATKAVLNSLKLQQLGWKAQYDIRTGIRHTLCILEEI